MTEFNDANKWKLINEYWYLVQCPEFCESGFEVAQWDGYGFISQANGDEINRFVKGFMSLNKIAVV